MTKIKVRKLERIEATCHYGCIDALPIVLG